MEHAPLHPSRPGLHRSRSTSTGTSRLRVVPWQGDPFVALVSPRPSGRGPNISDLHKCLEILTGLGVTRAVTPALGHADAAPFLQAGFELRERLHLLAYPITSKPELKPIKLRPGRIWHQRAVVEVDGRAFEPFWQFDRRALNEARHATPSHRFRVAHENGQVVGYAVTGASTERGYLQRLAVSPDTQGTGIGTALVQDCLNWLYRRGATVAMVNTQERNERAFELYKHLGFVPQPEGLVVLNWELPQ